jgi:hypothetical protein
MAQAVELILKTLDKHMGSKGTIRLMGGAALTLAYGLDRATEDADLLLDDTEAQFLAEHCDFGAALEKTNRELEPKRLYVSHIWGPEQQILTPEWRQSCRSLPNALQLSNLSLESLGPLDIIVSKMARADAEDLQDVSHLLRHEKLTAEQVRQAISRAQVPEILKEVFADSRPRIEALLREERRK